MKSVRYHYSGFVLARKGRQPELSGWSLSSTEVSSAVLRRLLQRQASSDSAALRCVLRAATALPSLSLAAVLSSTTAVVCCYCYPAQAFDRFQKRLQVDPGDYSLVPDRLLRKPDEQHATVYIAAIALIVF